MRRRALEKHKAVKHQIELVLAHFRNVYQAEAYAQIQRHMALTGENLDGFSRLESIIHQVNDVEERNPHSLLDWIAEKVSCT